MCGALTLRFVWGRHRRRSVGGGVAARILTLVLGLVLAGGCAPTLKGPGPLVGEARIEGDFFVAVDGARLPLRAWLPTDGIRAVVLGLHGFNDYSNGFALPAPAFTDAGIALYAYDQRGFGDAPHRGYWPGADALVADAAAAVQAVHALHPHTPLYVMGESMGGAVAMLMVSGEVPGTERAIAQLDGIILLAPAIWGGEGFGTFKRVALEIAAHTLPWYTLTGEGLDITPSDNIEMLRALARDPKVIKRTRIDAIYGLVDLMDRAVTAAPRLSAPTLILYGLKDEIVPKEPTLDVLQSLPEPPEGRWRIVVYEEGYHLLLRDLQWERVAADILAWIEDPDTDLGGENGTALAALRRSLGDDDTLPAKAFASGGSLQ